MVVVEEITTSDIITVRPEATLLEAATKLLEYEVSGLPVTTEDGQLVGIISEYALLAIAYDPAARHHKVSQHMTADVLTVAVHEPIERVIDLLILHRIRRLPVIDNGKLVGLVARRDVLRKAVSTDALQ